MVSYLVKKIKRPYYRWPMRSIIRAETRLERGEGFMSNDVDYYMQFVEALGDGATFTLSDWKIDFVEGLMKRPPRFLSAKQKDIIKEMTERYLHEEIH
jgi:hypothetical protein